MDEYISKKTIIDALEEENERQPFRPTSIYSCVIPFIRQLPAADVQPVNQWISVEDKLPIEQGHVLCYAHSTTGEGICLGTLRNGELWLLQVDGKQFSFPYLHLKVSHWMPLPEPPKEGDAE